ncbi:hypothetical protein ANN_14631 [Periplaneta americana]|uniref:Uncharacterized protein n=1 Tax=Periplaneta americana TaxID=6978 RepID=A0ABQ8SWV8_PERAM|nr:hypothetical protein ANN_14631 [Periplaneta americana]
MGESINAYRVLVGRPEGKRSLGRPRRRWEGNIKMDLREVGYDDREWINLAQDRDRCRAMNLRVPSKPVRRMRSHCTPTLSTRHGNLFTNRSPKQCSSLDYFDIAFRDRWIGRGGQGGPVSWPVRSPNLSVLDFLKGEVYRTPFDSAKDNVVQVFATAHHLIETPFMFVMLKWSKFMRCRACIESEGS